jgi:ribonuclease BN (tRNA processing enzyme)
MNMPPTTRCNFQIVNCWSLAGLGTSISLSFCPSTEDTKPGTNTNSIDTKSPLSTSSSSSSPTLLRRPQIILDLGATPIYGDATSASIILLTHGHLDHIGAIFSHARAYQLNHDGSVPTYYMPKSILPMVEKARDAMVAIHNCIIENYNEPKEDLHDNNPKVNPKDNQHNSSRPLPMKFIGVEPGQEYILPLRKHLKGNQIVIRTFETTHGNCPSVGYILMTRKRNVSLKDEYKGLSKEETRRLLQAGVPIKQEHIDEQWDLAYTGDTTMDGLRKDMALWTQCHTFLCECTYLESSEESKVFAHDRGHMHIQHIVQLLQEIESTSQLSSPPRILLLHISNRYTAVQTMDYLLEAIPMKFISQIHVAIMALRGSKTLQCLTNSQNASFVSLLMYQTQFQSDKRQG